MKVLSIVGARPNFMKVAPLHRAFQQHPEITSKVIHTGQHYDERMSFIFFNQLELPEPDYYLGVGSGSHAVITAKIMVAFEEIVLHEKPDLVLVVGDVNSTLACALVTKKLNIKLAHVEAGLRSGDRKMPEEINRILTDSISDYMFVTEESGMKHLKQEGVPDEKVFFTGNVMIDSLCYYQEKALQLPLLEKLDLEKGKFVLTTMHRPSNVDHPDKIKKILSVFERVGQTMKVVFSMHPRTEKNIKKFNLQEQLKAIPNLIVLKPQGYLEFLNLMSNSGLIITDSGGIQEESTYLKVPCLTVRDSTERPITITIGTNVLIPELDVDQILEQFQQCFYKSKADAVIPPLWDGKAATRIVDELLKAFSASPLEKPEPRPSANA
ncbi:MAG: non-hydrolyzing UDP-N-acetylglucosamine 2-epimerase [Saprospiraceae bacterium]